MKERLWAYTAGICRHQGIFVHSIGGMEDHIHLLLQFPPTLMIADAIRDIKSNSSGWMSSEIGRFAWQQGYGGFAVSKSNIAAVVRYIRNQEQMCRTYGARFFLHLYPALTHPSTRKPRAPGAPERAGLTCRRAYGAGFM